MPIDSKFPKEDYADLVDAYDKGDVDKIDEYRKAFINGIKKHAKDIKEKYIDPPNTTEYGIMFCLMKVCLAKCYECPGCLNSFKRITKSQLQDQQL